MEVPGFLFDMNRFWQALLGRLLRERLEQVTVIEDRAVHGALRYAEGHHHPRFRAPTARPDVVLTRLGLASISPSPGRARSAATGFEGAEARYFIPQFALSVVPESTPFVLLSLS